MELTRGTKAEMDARRVELIRDLCTGQGLTDELFVTRAEDFRVFGDYDVEVIEKLFASTADMLPENPFTLALMNALQPSDDGKNLTERRLDYAEKHGTISSRTLIRHEQEGAELFVKFFDIAESQYLRLKEEEESEDAARDADLEVMRRRLKKIEDGALLSRVADLELALEYNQRILKDLIEQLQRSADLDFQYPNLEDSDDVKVALSRISQNTRRDWLTGGGLPGKPALRTPRPSR